MSVLKFSGQKLDLSASGMDAGAWNFEPRPGGWIIATRVVGQKVERVRFFYDRHRQQFWAKVGTDFYGQKVEPHRQGANSGGAGDFTAQFPGKVRKVLVQAGAEVEAGQSLLMVEAMKMEFAIKSEVKGRVKAILVTEGQQLSPGQKLLDFEEAKA